MSKITKVWTFGSDSNPSKTYETLKYDDGSSSCNCPGWTRRVAADGSRSCKHTRLVDQNLADSHCISSKDYEGKTTSKATTEAAPTAPVKAKKHILTEEKDIIPVVRKIQWR